MCGKKSRKIELDVRAKNRPKRLKKKREPFAWQDFLPSALFWTAKSFFTPNMLAAKNIPVFKEEEEKGYFCFLAGIKRI